MSINDTKYLIAGTGGIGGSIAGFPSPAGKDVACIAHGARLQSIQTNGLKLKSDLKGEHTLQTRVTAAEEFKGKADVISVCMKGYSIDSITEPIKRASHEETVVTLVLNAYRTGPRIQHLVPGVMVLDGCIYIIGLVSGTEEIAQVGRIFRLVHGIHKGTQVASDIMEAIQKDLRESGIKAGISLGINRDTFVKWSFISVMAVTGAYYDVPIDEVQKPGKVCDTLTGPSTESTALERGPGVEFSEGPISYNLEVIDKPDPDSATSMQKDLAREHESEVQDLLFDMVVATEEQGIDIPTYRMVAEKSTKH